MPGLYTPGMLREFSRRGALAHMGVKGPLVEDLFYGSGHLGLNKIVSPHIVVLEFRSVVFFGYV